MSRDPSHPWVGESVPLDWANAITGPMLDLDGAALRYRVRSDGSVTVLSGDSFIAGFYESEVMLSGDDVEACFVLVCSGSGTIRLSGGTDPDWALDDPGDATVPMGTHTVFGDTVIVGDPFPTFDVDAYLAQVEETIVFVECLSGTVVVEQVKLRLWPPGGPVGGWVDVPAFDVTDAPEARLAAASQLGTQPATLTGVTAAATFAAAADEIVTSAVDPDKMQAIGSLAVSAIQAVVQAQVAVAEDSDTPGTFFAGSAGLLSGTLVQQPDPLETTRLNTPVDVGEYGLDYSWPPDEVPGDLGVDLLDDPTVAWGDYTFTTNALTIQADGSGGSATIRVTPVPDDAFADASLAAFPYVTGENIPPLAGVYDLDMPDARTVLVSLTHPFLNAAPLYGGGAGGAWNVGSDTSIAADLEDSTVTIPPHRYWAPALVDEPIYEPHQIFQRKDGLGAGSACVFDPATRQATGLVFGTH